MGLDQTIIAFKRREIKTTTGTVEEVFEKKLFHLRKVYPLQCFFKERYGTQNCVQHQISPEDLEELKDYTHYILNNPEDLEFIEDHFPPSFFFSKEEGLYDRYFEDVEEVQRIADELLKDPDIENIYYDCWY